MLGLIVVSALVVASKPTKLGLDLKGGVELVYQGTPTGQVKEVSGEDIDRSIEIIRERIDELGVAEPEVSRLGTTEISVSLPDVTNAAAGDRPGRHHRAALLLRLGTEPDRPREGDRRRPGPRTAGESASKRPNKEWEAAGRTTAQAENQQLIIAGAFPTAYAAVKLASEQKPEPDCTDCSTNRPRYYLFSGTTAHELIAGPEFADKDLFISPTGEKRRAKEGEIRVVVPPGTIVVSELPTDRSEPVDRGRRARLVRAQRRAGPLRHRHHRPEAGIRRTQPAERHLRLHRRGPRGVPGGHPRRSPSAARRGRSARSPAKQAEALSGHFAVVLDNEVKTRPIINFAENPDGIDGRTGAQISGGFTSIQEAQDLATFLQIGALPINLKLISQTPGLGDARRAGARPGPEGRPHRPAPGDRSSCSLYYRFLGVSRRSASPSTRSSSSP